MTVAILLYLNVTVERFWATVVLTSEYSPCLWLYYDRKRDARKMLYSTWLITLKGITHFWRLQNLKDKNNVEYLYPLQKKSMFPPQLHHNSTFLQAMNNCCKTLLHIRVEIIRCSFNNLVGPVTDGYLWSIHMFLFIE